MHRDSKITILLTPNGWEATFAHVDGMPDGEPLPLPFTSMAQANVITAHLHAHFPGARVEQAYDVPRGWDVIEGGLTIA